MKFFPFGSSEDSRPPETAVLAAQLRRLAGEVERGEISTVIATVIRRDGAIERIGDLPASLKTS